MREREIFLSAIEIRDASERALKVRAECDGDEELLARVNSLLTEHDSESEFLEIPAPAQIADRLLAAELPRTSLGDDSAAADREPVELRDRSRRAGSDREEDSALRFLEPSKKPGSLGRLAHYEVQAVVGRGAFGVVLEAFDERLRRTVAIKMLAPEMASTSPARKRFLREARAAAAVRHENVVAIHAVEDEPIPFFAMEYVPGETLQQRLDGDGPLSTAEALRLGKQIADGLAAAHERGLIHRDVKPANILLESGAEDRVKITDFGLARTADDASLSQSGMIAGTPMYMAPEQALGQKLDQRADLFSLGSVLYQMLSGRPPFRARTTAAVLKRVIDDAPRPLREIVSETPAWLSDLIGHLHAKNPDERYDSAKEVSGILALCLSEMQAGREPKIPPPRNANRSATEPVAPSNRRKFAASTIAVASAALALLLAGFGVTEAAGVTSVAASVIRLTTGSGVLVVETNDPAIQISVEGEEVAIRGGGVKEITLRPGDYRVEASKDGLLIKQELVTISRNGRTAMRLSLEPSGPAGPSDPSESAIASEPPTHAVADAPQEMQRFATDQWIDVLPLIDPVLDRWAVRGVTGKNEWKIEDDGLHVGFADTRANKLIFPLDVTSTGYECELELTRTLGGAGFAFNVPAGDLDCPIMFGLPPAGALVGRRGMSEHVVDDPLVETGKRTTLRFAIERFEGLDDLRIWKDGKEMGRWTGDRTVRSTPPEGYPAGRRLSLYVPGGGSRFIFHRIRVRALAGGESRTLRPTNDSAALRQVD